MATYQGVHDAKEAKHRDYRAVPDADLSIARGGKIQLGDQHLDPDDWPFLIIPAEDGLYPHGAGESHELKARRPVRTDSDPATQYLADSVAFPVGIPYWWVFLYKDRHDPARLILS